MMNQINQDAFAAGATEAVSGARQGPTRAGSRRVRLLERRDLEAVADVFLRVFRRIDEPARRAAAMPGVIAHLAEVYLDCPWLDATRGSLVLVDGAGEIHGFLGSIHLPMAFDGRPLLASAMGTFMVTDAERKSGAGLDLLRAHLANGLDLHFTDTANRISLGFRQGMRFDLLPLHSLEWVLALRPARFAAQRASRRWPFLPGGLLGRAAGPLDRPLRRALHLDDLVDDKVVVEETSRAAFFAFAAAQVAERRLRPDWTEARFDWLLDRAAARTGNGPLHLRQASDGRGRVLGCWLVYAESGSVASVLQIFAGPRDRRAVLAAVLHDADAMGCLAVRGTTEPETMEALYSIPGILFHHKGATALRAADPEVAAAARAGDLSIGGLTGESWTRFVSDRF